MSSSTRHHKLVQRTRHSHSWVVGWLTKHGWLVTLVEVPTRQQVLAGSKDKGTTYMSRTELGVRRSIAIPGARSPKESLSRAEWATFMTHLSSIYNEWGVPPPRAHHRMWGARRLS